MIAAGLCMMGGCFAQDAATRTVEAYWASESVPIPYSNGAVGIYEWTNLPPTPQSQLRFLTRQRYESGAASFFFLFQSIYPYNCFIGSSKVWLSSAGSEPPSASSSPVSSGTIIEIAISGAWMELMNDGTRLEVTSYNDEAKISKVCLLDARQGEKAFICCEGSVNKPFYVQACRSASGTVAIYDVKQKTLIEI